VRAVSLWLVSPASVSLSKRCAICAVCSPGALACDAYVDLVRERAFEAVASSLTEFFARI
jgi:hypothetical protein